MLKSEAQENQDNARIAPGETRWESQQESNVEMYLKKEESQVFKL